MTRFAADTEAGLVDTKYLVRDGITLSPEQLYAAVNSLDDSIEAGNCKRHEIWPDEIVPAESARVR